MGSLASRMSSLGRRTQSRLRGESVRYKWDEEILGGSQISSRTLTYTTTSETGTLQRSTTSQGPWEDVASLTPGTFNVTGAAWFRILNAGDGQTYWNISVEIPLAVRSRGNWRTDEPAATHVAVSERIQHWIIAVADLQHPNGNAAHEPKREDTIETADGETFRIMPQSKDGPLWRWTEESGKTHRRIFTRERSDS